MKFRVKDFLRAFSYDNAYVFIFDGESMLYSGDIEGACENWGCEIVSEWCADTIKYDDDNYGTDIVIDVD